MSRMLFVNLPVSDLDAAVAFFTELGFTFNQQFTDENATCMVVNDQACVMLLVEKFYATFTDKQLIDARTHTEAILSVSAESRSEVDTLVDQAVAAGGVVSRAVEQSGPMYGGAFADLDGHQWEVMYMDPAAFAQA